MFPQLFKHMIINAFLLQHMLKIYPFFNVPTCVVTYVVTHATTYVETDVALFDRKNSGKHIASYVITYAATYVAVLKMTKFQHRLYHL